MQEINKKLQSVYNLYKEWGSENERDTAKKMLETMCKKKWISFDNLEGMMNFVEMEKEVFEYSKKHETVYAQVIFSCVDGKRSIRVAKYWKKHYFVVEVTTKEKKAIDVKWKFYKKIFNKEYKDYMSKQEEWFSHAFVQKNKLFWEPSDDDIDDEPMDFAKAEKMRVMMRELWDHDFIPENRMLWWQN